MWGKTSLIPFTSAHKPIPTHACCLCQQLITHHTRLLLLSFFLFFLSFTATSSVPHLFFLTMEHHKPLLPTSSHAAPTSTTRKDLLFVVCALLFLSSLVAYEGYRASAVPNLHVSSPTSNNQQDHQSPTSLPSSKWYPVSRGVSSGVSEKSSNLLFAGEGGASEAFPWDNSMLSWQRTSFHFQPEKNWMNGNSFRFLASSLTQLKFYDLKSTRFSCLQLLPNQYPGHTLLYFIKMERFDYVWYWISLNSFLVSCNNLFPQLKLFTIETSVLFYVIHFLEISFCG